VAVGNVYILSPDTLTLNNLTIAYAAGTGSTVKEWNFGSVKLASGPFDPGFVPEGLIRLGTTYSSVVFAREGAGDTITRMDGGSWLTDGVAAGQTIAVSGTTYNNVNFTLISVTASTLRVSVANSVIPTTPGTTESARITADIGTVAEVGTQFNITLSGGNKITRNDVGGSWITDGFAMGQTIAVFGTGAGGVGLNNQVYKILNVTASTLTVDKAVTAKGPENAIISGGAAKRDILFLVDLQPAFLALLNGNSSLTLQRTIVERNRLGQNADFFVFPLANQYTFDGNDVLDAHSLFASIPNGLLPAVGLTLYGGRGDDLIIGSAAGDHLAGGSGNDMIMGERGVDHIYGDSGINVDVITRVLTIAETAGYSGASNLDPLFAGNDLIYGDAPGSTATDVYGDYNDVVFGDLGDVGQATSGPRDTTKPISLTPQRIETTLLARTITSQSRQNAGDDIVYGNGGDDVLIGGAGNDAIDGGGDLDLIFGDSVSLSRSGHLGNFSILRFETLQGTQIYRTASTTAGQDLASKVPQADPRGHGAWGDYVISILDHADVPVVNSFGNDYIAGGPADDMIFGEMGNDTVQGDGAIDYISHVLKDDGNGHMIPDPAYPIGGPVGVLNVAANYAGNPFRDNSNALVLRPSFDGSGNKQDYIEGGAGNDIFLGN
jgi:Ca2+-binding RTX toxin-like protein